MQSDAAREALAQAALEIGFDAVGWAGARVPEGELETFKGWIGGGMHAGMDYLPKSVDRRADVTTSFEPTLGVLALMVSHNHADPGVPSDGVRVGRVARYAWSRDYHASLKPHLERLEKVAAQLGVQAMAYIDHGPILERSFAVRAGLGWRGRSSQVISTKLGALTTLAVVLTDLEPPPEEVGHPERCGRCTACVRACPTDAITPDRLVDSNRCIAYYTVEHRGSVPLELRPSFGDHLFGCDDCLEICPWTTHAGRLSGLLEPDPDLVHPDITDCFALTGHQFERRFETSAFSRARRKGMARNAAIVLGNLRDPAHLSLLEMGLADTGWEVREACAWALGRFEDDPKARAMLERGLKDPDERVVGTVKLGLEGRFLASRGP
jgi:epoxyqueuosine reductase